MEKHTCSECKSFHPGYTGNEGMGFCRQHLTEVWCATLSCCNIDLKPLADCINKNK